MSIVSKITIDSNVLKAAILDHINVLIQRKNNPNAFTKFDSENDAFLGSCGEYAFAKYLSNKGFERGSDYFQINRYKSNIKYKEHFKEVDGVLYDKYDFLLDIFYDDKYKKTSPMKIDIKTQKYVGTHNADWQFAVNSNTVEQLKKDPKKIDNFLFIFSKNGLSDVVDTAVFEVSVEELEKLKNNIEPLLKKTKIELELLGMIEPSKFLSLSESFEKGEIFRMNSAKDKINSYKAFSPMHRINLQYLANPNKIIVPRRTNKKININSLNEYHKKLNHSELLVKISDADNETFFPYDKVYLNSQHRDFDTFVERTLSKNNQENNNFLNRKGYRHK